MSGLTRFDLRQIRVTVPDGTSTMVAIINQDCGPQKQTFLYLSRGARARGTRQNPYRVDPF